MYTWKYTCPMLYKTSDFKLHAYHSSFSWEGQWMGFAVIQCWDIKQLCAKSKLPQKQLSAATARSHSGTSQNLQRENNHCRHWLHGLPHAWQLASSVLGLTLLQIWVIFSTGSSKAWETLSQVFVLASVFLVLNLFKAFLCSPKFLMP